jgi:hypothetical protein
VKRLFVVGAIAAAMLAGSVLPQTGSARGKPTVPTSLYLGTKRISVLSWIDYGPLFEVPVSSGAGDTTWVALRRGIVWVLDPGSLGPDEHIGYARRKPGGLWYVNSWTFAKEPVVTIGTVRRSSISGRWDAYCGLGGHARHYGYATGPHPALGAVALLLLFGNCSG